MSAAGAGAAAEAGGAVEAAAMRFGCIYRGPYVSLSCSAALFFPFFGGCPTKNGLPQKGFPFPGSLNN